VNTVICKCLELYQLCNFGKLTKVECSKCKDVYHMQSVEYWWSHWEYHPAPHWWQFDTIWHDVACLSNAE